MMVEGVNGDEILTIFEVIVDLMEDNFFACISFEYYRLATNKSIFHGVLDVEIARLK